jgi:predicted nuclease with TOPRIM domain
MYNFPCTEVTSLNEQLFQERKLRQEETGRNQAAEASLTEKLSEATEKLSAATEQIKRLEGELSHAQKQTIHFQHETTSQYQILNQIHHLTASAASSEPPKLTETVSASSAESKQSVGSAVSAAVDPSVEWKEAAGPVVTMAQTESVPTASKESPPT